MRFPTSLEHLLLSVLLALKQYVMSDDQAASYNEVKLDKHFKVGWGALARSALDRSEYAFFPSTLAVHMFSRLVAVLQTKEGLGVTEGLGGTEVFRGVVGECTFEGEAVVVLDVEETSEGLEISDCEVVFAASETNVTSVKEILGVLGVSDPCGQLLTTLPK